MAADATGPAPAPALDTPPAARAWLVCWFSDILHAIHLNLCSRTTALHSIHILVLVFSLDIVALTKLYPCRYSVDIN